MLPDDQRTVPTAPPNVARASGAGAWVAPTVDELQPKLPQYEVLDVLGRGGMGAVYKARQRSLKRLVAIKILPLAAADDEMQFAARFRHEAETMAQMNHPAILGVYDFGETPDGLLFIVMEFVDGTDVQQTIKATGRLDPSFALTITAHVCDALHYAHSRGVIHRDIKPANVLLDREGRVKVADFGLAKMSDPAMSTGLTHSSMAMGTPDYVAPEVLIPGSQVDHRADLYAVGVMLYQMLTGEVPRGLFKLPSQKRPGTDPRFDEIVCKAMEQDRDERFQSALDVRKALDAIQTTPMERVSGQVTPSGQARQVRPDGHEGDADTPVRTADGTTMRARESRQRGLEEGQQMEADRIVRGTEANPRAQRGIKAKILIAALAAIIGMAAFLVLNGRRAPLPGAGSPSAHPTHAWTDRLASQTFNAPWHFDGKALTATEKNQVIELGGARNGAVRLYLREDPAARLPDNNPPLQVVCRSTLYHENVSLKGGYQFQVFPHKRSANLLFLQKPQGEASQPPETLWLGEAILKDSGEAQLEFRAQDDEIRLLSGGRVVGSVRDSRVASGSWKLLLSPGVQIVKLETMGLGSDPSNAPAPAPQAADSNTDPAFFRAVAEADAQRQIALVKAKLEEINQSQATLTPTIRDGKVAMVVVHLMKPKGPKLWPIGALRDVEGLQIYTKGVEDISWLRGLKITLLTLPNGAFSDLHILRELPIKHLDLANGPPRDYSVLVGMPLQRLGLSGCPVADLSFVRGMPIDDLRIDGTKVTDFSPIAGLPLKEITVGTLSERARDILASIPTLTNINGKPAAEFFRSSAKEAGAPRSGAIDAGFAREIEGVPAMEQVARVGAKIRAINGMEVKLEPSIKVGQVIGVRLSRMPGRGECPDISPVAAWRGLKSLIIHDLNPHSIDCLRGLQLENIDIHTGSFADVSALADMPLTTLTMRQVLAGDFSVLHGKPLTSLDLNNCVNVKDISFVKGMPLKRLNIAQTNVRDLSPLAGLPLVELDCNEEIQIDEKFLRNLPQLKTINGKSVAGLLLPNKKWVDWFTSERARPGGFQFGGWITENDGVTTDQPLKGTFVLPAGTRDGAVRMTYRLRSWLRGPEGEGASITIRDRRTAGSREFYVAHDTGANLFIARAQGDEQYHLARRPIPSTIAPDAERTLEFRFVGNQLTATLNGTFSIAARDGMLTDGPCAVVINKGTLLTKAETMVLDAVDGGAAAWQPLFAKPEDIGADLEGIEFRNGWLHTRLKKGRNLLSQSAAADGAVRARMRHDSAGMGSVTIRREDESFACRAAVADAGKTAVIAVREGIDQETRETSFPLRSPILQGDEFLIELQARGQELTVLVNGMEIGKARAASARGECRFGVLLPGGEVAAEFRDIAWQRLK